jgi:hypothetical protein
VFGATRAQLVRESFGDARFLGVVGSSSPLHAANVMGSGIADAIGLPHERPFNQLEKLALLCAVVGAIALLRRNRTQLSMMILPFLLLLGASAAHVYPITKRTELFLVPVVVLMIAEGVVHLARIAPRRGRAATAFLLVIAVGAGPVWLAGSRLVHPRTVEELKPVLAFVSANWKRGDTLYVHYGAQYALLYYEECNCFRLSSDNGQDRWPLRPREDVEQQYAQAAVPLGSDVVLGSYHGSSDRRYVEDLDRVRGRRRVWFLYTHIRTEHERSVIRERLVPHMALLGKRIKHIDRTGAHAYLYRLYPIAGRTAPRAFD